MGAKHTRRASPPADMVDPANGVSSHPVRGGPFASIKTTMWLAWRSTMSSNG